jgi:hypothetical protein
MSVGFTHPPWRSHPGECAHLPGESRRNFLWKSADRFAEAQDRLGKSFRECVGAMTAQLVARRQLLGDID